MSEQTPEHRMGVTPRSGDTHVIGADGAAVNIDQAARALRQAQDERSEEAKAERKARPAPAADAAKGD